jgi:hypothetical protein
MEESRKNKEADWTDTMWSRALLSFDLERTKIFRPKTYETIKRVLQALNVQGIKFSLDDIGAILTPEKQMKGCCLPIKQGPNAIVMFLAPDMEIIPQTSADYVVAHEFAHVNLKHHQIPNDNANPAQLEFEADKLAESWGFKKPEKGKVILEVFANLLEERLGRGKRQLTEDSVRYTFFYALTTIGNVNPCDIILESSNTEIRREETDMMVVDKDGNPKAILEFKCDRAIPSGKNLNETQRAGKVIRDIFRLTSYGDRNIKRYFVYVTDNNMSGYFQNPINKLGNLFDLKEGTTFKLNNEYLQFRSPTFTKAMGRPTESLIISAFSRDFNSGWYLRIYEISPILQ